MTKTLALFYLSCLLAFVSGHTVNYSIIIFAQDVLQSDLLSGIGFGLCFGPPVILGWYAGVLCDRLAPGRIIVLSQLVFMGAGGLLLGASVGAQSIEFKAGLLAFAALFAGCGWSFISPARFSALAQIVTPEKLHGATVVLNLLTMLGFGVAPIVIAVIHMSFGWNGVFITATVSFAVASLLMAWTPTQGNLKVRHHVLVEVREGVRAAVSKPLLLQLLLANVLAYSLMGPMQVLLPRLAGSQLLLSGIDRGLYLGILALALMIGGVLCMAMKRQIHDGLTILSGAFVAGLSIIIISQISLPFVSAVVLLASGITGGMVVSLIVAGLQAETAPDVRGRVMSMYTISSQIVPAATGFVAGGLSEYLGVVAAMVMCGGMIALAALLGLMRLTAVRAYSRAY